MDLITFDPTIDQLNRMIAVTSAITAEDLSDDKQIAIVKENRLNLRDARIAIEKKGKELRADALKYQKDVIAKEKELLSIIGPEEDRLKELEDKAAQIKVRAARQALLPMRKEQLSLVIQLGDVVNDDTLLDMDNDEFITYLNTLKAEKLDRDMAEVKAREAAIADKERIAQVAEEARVAERNRLEALERADAAALEKKNAYEKQQIELEAQRKVDEANAETARLKAQEEARLREIEIRAQQEKNEYAKRAADQRYQEWLGDIGYKEADAVLWQFKQDGNITGAFKFVGSFVK